MTVKFTIEYIRPKFEERGWRLLAEEYPGSQKPMAAVCAAGHETTISWNNFQKGQGCRFCAGNVQYTLEQVEGIFRDGGCELMADTYKNVLTPVRYRCSCGNVSEIRLADFLEGGRCWECRAGKISVANRTNEEEIAAFCKNHDCQFIESFIIKKRVRIQYVCKCGELAEADLCNFKRYPNCKKCGNKKVSGDKCHLWNPDREKVAMNKKYQKICGRILRRCMLKTGQEKRDHTHILLGYTAQQLREHIENHPNYPGKDVPFHIDHIFPLKAFIDHGIFELKIINALDNLRPLPGPENLSKAGVYDKTEFNNWVKNK